ncbi:MAG: thiazole synthase [Pseudomonadota bacterium]
MTTFYGTALATRLMLGTALYPSPAVLAGAFRTSGASVATVSLRREGGALAGGGRAGDDFWRLIRELGVHVLPNTAGCHTIKEAVTTAQMAREVFQTPWIKLEIIGNAETLQPDPFALPEAARLLTEDGFQVFPYTTEDLILAEHLLEAGCEVLMPWGAPIGTGLGLTNPYGLRTLRARFPDIPMVVDAGIGLPSHAAQAMEMGFDAILLNTAVAKAGDPAQMALAFARAVEAGLLASAADPMEPRDMAAPSTPVIGKAFLE